MSSRKHEGTSTITTGLRYDGTANPLDRPLDIGDYGAAFMRGATSGYVSEKVLSEDDVVNMSAPGKVSNTVYRDWMRIAGRAPPDAGPVEGEYVRELLRKWGHDPDKVMSMPDRKRIKLANKLTRHLHEMVAKREQGREVKFQEAIGSRPVIERSRAARHARSQLHVELRAWAEGPLHLEHPQGSSYHHLLSYDSAITIPGQESLLELERRVGRPQLFVVERDWARAFSGYDLAEGEVRLPFDHCCFEFRISGVRVLALVREIDGVETGMFCIYGKNGHWVVDDYTYVVSDGQFRRSTPEHAENLDRHEFQRVNQLVWNEIRVASIMVDATVAHAEPHAPRPKLVERMRQERREPPRSYYVVDLKRRVKYDTPAHRSYSGGTGVRMRGHFRRGTWVHYQHDGGDVKYVNDGGFWLSRTWRPWHFAGDPNNMIEKEYRL